MKTQILPRCAMLLAVLLTTAPETSARQAAGAPPAPAPQQTAAPSPLASPQIPSFPNTPQGLEALMKEMMRIEKKEGAKSLAPYAESLALPDAENWFKSVFGEKLGPDLAAASERARMEIAMSAPDFLARARTEKLSEIQAVRFDEECNRLATDSEFAFLQRRVRFDPLYDVRFHDKKKQLIWSYFAYVDGGFRYIGTLALRGVGPDYQLGRNPPPLKGTSAAGQNGPRRIQVGGPLQRAQLLASCQAVPVYPDDAKAAHVSGTVILHVLIGTDGEVHDIRPISGPPMLIGAAVDAVKSWRYRPTLFNGEPVEVDSTVSVIFTLS